ncbi:hypothetical protein FQR65_LT11509 [Abscondita terminalis]|nr:hypothetical protein FQR65_LT11509 [Abscondita terminalis]
MDRKRRKNSTVRLTRRRSLNVANFIFTCCVLTLAIQLASSNFTARINKISNDLHKALDNALEPNGPNYTDLYINVTYHEVKPFDPKGMGGLYNITTKFIDVLVPTKVFPDGFIKISRRILDEWDFAVHGPALAKHYAGLIAVVSILLLFGIFMPICGLCFCCCRCCGKCGARSKPFDKKGDLCRKICLATFLIIVGTLMLFGVVCAFVSNQHMQDGTDELPSNLKTSLKNVDMFLNTTEREVNALLHTNYDEFEVNLFTTLDKCSDIVMEQLTEYSNATALTEVVNMVNGLNDIHTNMTFMKKATNELQSKADDLKGGLSAVKASLVESLQECDVQPCKDFESTYMENLKTDIDYNNLPDISNQLDELNNILRSGIQETVNQGLEAFQNIEKKINGTIADEIPKVKTSVEDAGQQISAGRSNVTRILQKTKEIFHDYSDQPLKDMETYLKEYSPYRYYLGLGVSCVLLLITLCITLGLICGVCGKRPDAYSDDCCNKGAGSRFLLIGVTIMFMFAIIVVVVTAVHLLLGILSQKVVCNSLRNQDHEVIKLLDDFIDLKESLGLDVNISWVLSSCNSNSSVYNVFQLQSLFNLNDVANYIDKFNINKTLENLTSQINASTQITILNKTAEDNLNKLSNSGIDNINFDIFAEELNSNLTSVNLSKVAEELDKLAKVVRTRFPEVSRKLLTAGMKLRGFQQKFVVRMTEQARELINVAQNLEVGLKFGKRSLKEAIDELIIELKSTEYYLNCNGSDAMNQIAQDFGRGIEKQVRIYLDRVVDNTRHNVGSCGPLSAGINSTLTATCDKLLLPWNGFWFSLMWCLILFIPTIILSVKLASLYQKYEPYPGPLVEANVNDKRVKMKNKKKQKGYERGSSYGPDAGNERGIPRDMPSGSHYQDTRYADMAPKHWDEFPAGGPPQYQRAPTEYERPPPYYYPGT